MKRDMVNFGNSQDKASSVVFGLFVVYLTDIEDSRTGENCSNQRLKEQRLKQDYFLNSPVGRR